MGVDKTGFATNAHDRGLGYAARVNNALGQSTDVEAILRQVAQRID
jgi:predicted transposase YdaD